ncbi:hypothetical protein [Antarcticirhabdus aurantiaca]|uniref:Uncharacterized protein n=1 Tax=Antarcticirhabdus aurantiaca TaxID=2606717 RepID=A0ACD4NW53_9HYPH|nr:hypothetical protein [Antarcticirhabdus aurantiaca]WAJ31003.1 hypothetical protein OXU80_12685 [Jeongeuplla avenae]
MADAKAIVRAARPPTADAPAPRDALRRTMREFSSAFVEEVGRIASLAADVDPTDETRLAELAARARAVLPIVSALDTRPVVGEPVKPNPLVQAVSELAAASDAEGIYAVVCRMSGRATLTQVGDEPTSDVAAPSPVAASPGPRSVDASESQSGWLNGQTRKRRAGREHERRDPVRPAGSGRGNVKDGMSFLKYEPPSSSLRRSASHYRGGARLGLFQGGSEAPR